MATTSGDNDYGTSGNRDGVRPPNLACGADDLKVMLAALARQFTDSDQRNSDALRDMQGRLELLGRGAESMREHVPPQFATAFARIKDGVQSLAGRVATVGREREVAKAAANLMPVPPAASVTPQTVAPVTLGGAAASSSVPLILPTEPRPAASGDLEARLAPATTGGSAAVVVANADHSEPWDRASADALVRLYDTGEACVRSPAAHAAAMHQALPPADADLLRAATDPFDCVGMPDKSVDEPAVDGHRVWLEERFAAIAARIEHSAVAMNPDSNLANLDKRLEQLETRFGTALADVATRSDVEGLRIVEAHLNELVAQFERTELQWARLDQIETQLGDVARQLSDDRLAGVFAQSKPPAHQGRSDDEIELVAMAVADRVVSRLPQPLFGTSGADPGSISELQRVVETFAAGQRESEEHTSTVLDAMQQAMIRMLDRMDAIENAAPAFAPQSTYAPPVAKAAVGSAPVQPKSPSVVPAAPALAPAAVNIAPQDGDAAYMAHAAGAGGAGTDGVAARADDAGKAAPAPQDFRAAAVADARRAARKVAARAAEAPSLELDAPRARLTPSVQFSTAEPIADEAPRVRTSLMVAGAALIVGVSVLAATVGYSRSSGMLSAQQSAEPKVMLSVDNGDGDGAEAPAPGRENDGQKALAPAPQIDLNPTTPRAAPAAAAPKPGAALDPRNRIRVGADPADDGTGEQQAAPVEATSIQQEAALAAPGAAQPRMPLGMVVTQSTGSIPPNSDLARLRQQRNMASLASQLAAVQANAPVIPASLMPDLAVAQPTEGLNGEAGQVAELPPAFVGPISLRTAAQKGDPSAEFEVAARFAEGRGIGQDFKQAMTWYQRSAQRGFAPAQYRLGTLFERGIGTKADLARAKVWYGRAAEQGHVKAMHNLAVLNAGRDPSSDYSTALQWFTAAAERGLADSQYNLGVLYESGLGLQRDYKQAYLWLSLAARSGDKDAGRRRDQIRAKMEEAEVVAADATVVNWRAKPSDSAVNDPRVAGETWKSRQSVGR